MTRFVASITTRTSGLPSLHAVPREMIETIVLIACNRWSHDRGRLSNPGCLCRSNDGLFHLSFVLHKHSRLVEQLIGRHIIHPGGEPQEPHHGVRNPPYVHVCHFTERGFLRKRTGNFRISAKYTTEVSPGCNRRTSNFSYAVNLSATKAEIVSSLIRGASDIFFLVSQ